MSVVNAYWSSSTDSDVVIVPDLIQDCLVSWLLHGHTVNLWSDRPLAFHRISDYRNLIFRNTNEILTIEDLKVLSMIDQKLVQTDSHSNVAMTTKANYIRLRILQAVPASYWIDSDLLCLSTDIPATVFPSMISLEKSDVYDSSHVFPGMSPTNMFLQFNNQALLADVIAKLKTFIETKNQIRRGKTGPSFIRSLFVQTENVADTLSIENCMLLDPSVFCPINWHEMDLFYKPMSEIDHALLSEAKGIHLWYSLLDKSLITEQSLISHLLNQIHANQAPSIT